MKKIPLFYPYVSWLARLYALIVLSGKQIAEGPVVKAFEREFGEKFRKRNVVSVNSGTSALELAYELAGIGAGDEVIAPVLTCTATNLPLVRRGAKIVFADIDPATLNMDPKDVARKITPQTKAIVFVHFGGASDGLDEIAEIAWKAGVKLIEDAAQCVGAPKWEWGVVGDYTCVSLQAIKTLTAGDGGFLICKDDEDAKKARMLRWFGYDRALKQKLGDTDLTLAGYKYHMNDVNAAIGIGNLRALDWLLEKRAKVRRWYGEEIVRQRPQGCTISMRPWLVILMTPKAREVDKILKRNGVGSGPYHYRNDKYSVFKEAQLGGFHLPNMDASEEGYTLLPFHHRMTRKDVKRVVSLVRYALSDAFKPEDISATSEDIWGDLAEREYGRTR